MRARNHESICRVSQSYFMWSFSFANVSAARSAHHAWICIQLVVRGHGTSRVKAYRRQKLIVEGSGSETVVVAFGSQENCCGPPQSSRLERKPPRTPAGFYVVQGIPRVSVSVKIPGSSLLSPAHIKTQQSQKRYMISGSLCPLSVSLILAILLVL